MDSDRAFAELEEELKRATWDTVSTKIKKKPERNSQNGNRDNINYMNNRNNSSQAPLPNRGPRGGGPVPNGGRGRAGVLLLRVFLLPCSSSVFMLACPVCAYIVCYASASASDRV